MDVQRLIDSFLTRLHDTWRVYVHELRRVFRDSGVMLIFFVAGLAYPILYNIIYIKNIVRDVEVAVVDMSASQSSREFVFRFDATPEVCVSHTCATMDEAKALLKSQKVHGILYIPADYETVLVTGLETAHISLYCDMSSFLYMKNVYTAANMVMLDYMNRIQVDRYEAVNIGEEMSWALVQAVPFEAVALFNPSGGYGSFLVPAILVLIVFQTLFFGINMLHGTAREENTEVYILPGRKRRASVFRLLVGRGAAYFVLYMAIGAFGMILVPVIFDLPHLALVGDMLRFMVPFLLASVYFSIFLASFQRERETGMVTMLFSSLIFFFVSGFSWPWESMNPYWKAFGYILPSTWGMHGYLHMQSMGATLATTAREYNMLWLLALIYFLACVLLYGYKAWHYDAAARREQVKREQMLRQRWEEGRKRIEERHEKGRLFIEQHLPDKRL
ncbi:MAG: ABC transporter permease [Paludibacteraceae bacterium]|nr:ABC transporter permease [Paludibacteraceae bacterium]